MLTPALGGVRFDIRRGNGAVERKERGRGRKGAALVELDDIRCV